MKIRKLLISILTGLCACFMSATLFTACGGEDHTHAYTAQTTTEATCTEKGVITYTCSCNDTYTEEIPELGHVFTNYVSDNNATCEKDGTETAQCDRENCVGTDTRTEENSILEHTYSEKVIAEKYFKCGPTPEAPATYYYSCKCGVMGTETFYDENNPYIPSMRVTLNSSNQELCVGDTYTLSATIYPSTATNKAVTWTTDNPLVATVKDGVVTAVDAGVAIITVTTVDGRKASCEIKSIIPVESVAINETTVKIYVGEPLSLEATVSPENATYQTITWTSSNESVATVNENGVITARTKGKTTITATSTNGKKATCSVSVIEGEIQFTLSDDLFYYVSGYVGYAKHVEIPNMHDGVRVTRIAENAFKGNTTLQTIVLPNSIQTIDANAFNGCTALKNIEIPESVTDILPYTFANCTSLVSVTLNERITKISEHAFENCKKLKDITFNKNGEIKLQVIGDYAFANCVSMNTFEVRTVLTNLTTIGAYAFSKCTGLQSVSLPSSMEKIANNAFEYCSALETITFANGLEIIQNNAFDYCTGLKTIVFPYTLTSIGNMAFRHAESLTSVQLPASLQTIGGLAFQYCISLQEVIIPQNVTQIGNSAFSYCEGLKKLSVYGDIANWGDSAFYECKKLENVYINSAYSQTIKQDNYIFYNAGVEGTGITLTIGYSAIIPERLFVPVENEGNYPKITKIVVEDGATTVNAFKTYNRLPYLTQITMPDSVTSIPYGIFNNSLWWTAQKKGVVYIDNVFYYFKCNCKNCTPSEIVVENYVDSDCLNDGSYDNVVTCTVCNYEVLRETIVIPAKGHSPLDAAVENYVDSDCENDGSQDNVIYCDRCEDELSRETIVIPAKGHSSLDAVVENYVDSDCTNDGSYDNVVYCAVCEDELSRETVVIPALGHKILQIVEAETVQNYTTTNATNYPFSISGNQITSTNKKDSSSATYTITAQRAFTLELQYKVSSEQKYDWLIIKHNSTEKVKTSGTSTTSFTTLTITMQTGDKVTITYSKDSSQKSGSDCAWVKIITPASETITEEVEQLVTPTEEIIASLLTCTEDVLCAVCNSIIAEKLGHDYISHEAQAATCLEIGWNAYNTCSRCDYNEYVEITALGHDYISHEAQAPTCGDTGWTAYDTCSRCDYTSYTELPITDNTHNVQNGYCIDCNQAESTPGLTYSKNSDGTYTVTGIGTCTETEIVISIYNNKNITKIADQAFKNCSSLTSVVIPDSVTSIGNSAFAYCSSLASVVIPNSVTSIGDAAFYSCDSLTSVVIGDNVTSIGKNAFSGCSSLTAVYITDIAAWCNISFGNIYANPLYCAKNLYLNNELVTELVIPDTVMEIKSYAFSGCSSLTAVYITDIEAWCNISFGGYHANPLYYAKNLYVNNELVTELVIPDTVTEIKPYAFAGCSSLAGVVIPDSVTSIGNDAFAYCSSLTSVEIPNSVTSIGNYAFYSCDSLTSIVIPDSVTSIGEYAFYYCSSLTSVVIPDSVTSIGNYAFYDCDSLTSVVIGDSVTSIGEGAFYNCSSLTAVYITDIEAWCNISFGGYYANPLDYAKNLYLNNELVTELVIPDTVTEIKPYAFYNCSSLTSVVIPDSVTSIGDYAFYYCDSLTSITIPDSVTSIGSCAFEDCSSLTSVVIGDSVTTIGSSAFEDCSSLTSVIIPDSVTSIGYEAFYDCDSLTSVVIGDSVTSIGSDAFAYCSNLTSVVIGDSVTSIDYDEAFYGCSSLTSVVVSESNTAYQSIDGNLYSKDGKTLIKYAIGKTATSFTIPDSVTTIYSRAFYDCDRLESMIIPKTVQIIGGYAFMGCRSLVIYCEVESKPSGWENATWNDFAGAFWNDCNCPVIWDYRNNDIDSNGYFYTPIIDGIRYGLKGGTAIVSSVVWSEQQVKIPSSIFVDGISYVVNAIADYAFYEFEYSLKEVVIPSTIKSIGYAAFGEDIDVKAVYYEGSTLEEWKQISINPNDNEGLTSAPRYYYSENKPTTSGKYWHYANGVPTKW